MWEDASRNLPFPLQIGAQVWHIAVVITRFMSFFRMDKQCVHRSYAIRPGSKKKMALLLRGNSMNNSVFDKIRKAGKVCLHCQSVNIY